MTFVAVAKLKHLSTFFILQAKASVFLCVLVPWWLKEAPRNHHDTKNFTENVVQQPQMLKINMRTEVSEMYRENVDVSASGKWGVYLKKSRTATCVGQAQTRTKYWRIHQALNEKNQYRNATLCMAKKDCSQQYSLM